MQETWKNYRLAYEELDFPGKKESFPAHQVIPGTLSSCWRYSQRNLGRNSPENPSSTSEVDLAYCNQEYLLNPEECLDPKETCLEPSMSFSWKNSCIPA